jgi:citrate/tricarballylate utilization protein
MSDNAINEARRQIEICNACRYCEGYCSVFPAITRKRSFSDGDITQLANLCHNCRGCYYACQYTHPHEFDLNVPAILARVRSESWERFIWPKRFSRLFQRSGIAVMAMMVAALTVFLALFSNGGENFYDVMPHNIMVAVFAPSFLLPLISIFAGLYRYWKHVGGRPIRIAHLFHAARMAADMKDLSGGQGQGCNFEIGDRYSNSRRWFHQAVLYGFILCFAATSVATLMHYVLDMPAPYALVSLPKFLGVPGGFLLLIGSAGLVVLKTHADKKLGTIDAWGGEMAFILLLFVVAATGLALAGAAGTTMVPLLLALHLGSVLTFFLLMPYSKMVHGFFRFAALLRGAKTLE